MAVQWGMTNQLSAQHGVKFCIYGSAGAGKTSLSATAPTPFIISAESGLLSLRKHQIPTALIDSIKDLEDLLSWCYYAKEAQQFATICLDSISEMAERCLTAELLKARDPRQAYGNLSKEMLRILRGFRDMPGKHVYFAAKMEVEKDVGGVNKVRPSMPGNILGAELPYFFDELFYLGIGTDPQTQQKHRYLLTQPDMSFEAKDRSGMLAAIEPPDLTRIINKIAGSN